MYALPEIDFGDGIRTIQGHIYTIFKTLNVINVYKCIYKVTNSNLLLQKKKSKKSCIYIKNKNSRGHKGARIQISCSFQKRAVYTLRTKLKYRYILRYMIIYIYIQCIKFIYTYHDRVARTQTSCSFVCGVHSCKDV